MKDILGQSHESQPVQKVSLCQQKKICLARGSNDIVDTIRHFGMSPPAGKDDCHLHGWSPYIQDTLVGSLTITSFHTIIAVQQH